MQRADEKAGCVARWGRNVEFSTERLETYCMRSGNGRLRRHARGGGH